MFFKDKDKVDFINPFVFKHQKENWEYSDTELRLIFVELLKFKKGLAELKTLADKWIFFIKEAPRLDDIPESLGVVKEIELALNIANKINMAPEELEIVERRAIALQDERGQIAYAEQEAEARGEARGEIQGGLSEAIAFVMGLLRKRFKDLPTAINNQIEYLPVEDLENLGEYLLDFNSLEDLETWLSARIPNQN
ncbi:DUF4351 domain-containing protein [Trichodesmium erythraeum]|uniref:DUF4351 domain-containing protein n=1 Tax=Trichodesmium erythraeum TaxID=1206 RepID=UPI00351BE956